MQALGCAGSYCCPQKRSKARSVFTRSVNLYWWEKGLVLLRFLQIQALLWIISSRWPWPAQWMGDTSFVLFTVFDLYSWTKELGLTLSNGAFTTFMVLLPVIVGVLAYFAISVYRRKGGKYGENVFKIKRVCIYAGGIYYIPFLIHVLRVWPTECTDGKMTYFDGVECMGIIHIGSAVICFILSAIYVFWAPYYMYTKSSKLAVYQDTNLHEQNLQTTEVEYLMEFSDHYVNSHLHVIAPYRRFWVHTKVFEYVWSTILVAVAVLGRRISATAQIGSFLTFVMVEPVIKMRYLQYRCNSTNLLVACFDWSTPVMAMFGLLSHNSERNALFLDKQLTLLLRALTVFPVTIVIVAVIVYIYKGWEYTISTKLVRRIMEANKRMIDQIRAAHGILQSSTFLPPEFVDRGRLRRTILELHKMRENPTNKGHVLEWTIQDTVKSLILLFENSERLTLLPNQDLVKALDGLKDRMNNLENERILIHPNMKELFSRLQVVRYLLPDEYIDGDRNEWEEKKQTSIGESWLEEMNKFKINAIPLTNLAKTENRASLDTEMDTDKLWSLLKQDGKTPIRPGSAGRERKARVRKARRSSLPASIMKASFAEKKAAPFDDLNRTRLAPSKGQISAEETKGLIDESDEGRFDQSILNKPVGQNLDEDLEELGMATPRTGLSSGGEEDDDYLEMQRAGLL